MLSLTNKSNIKNLKNNITKQIAGGEGLESGAELLGLKKKDEYSDITAAHGGRIDSPLMGRRRDI